MLPFLQNFCALSILNNLYVNIQVNKRNLRNKEPESHLPREVIKLNNSVDERNIR